MKKIFILISLLFLKSALFAQSYPVKEVMVAGKKMAYRSFGLENHKPGEPVLIFESGLGTPGDNYQGLFGTLSKTTAGIAYDRNGIGGSEADPTIKTDADVVKRLHALLDTLHIQPPYLLIGHSIGGPLVRLYTAFYPDQVAGLVLIDPTDYRLTSGEDNEVKKNTSSAMGYRELWVTNLKQMSADTSLPVGTRIEMQRELSVSSPAYFGEYENLPPLPDIPVTIFIVYIHRVEKSEATLATKLKINIVPWYKLLDKDRVEHYEDLVAANHHSNLVLLPNYSHGVHNQDPDLVINSILKVYHDSLLKPKKK